MKTISTLILTFLGILAVLGVIALLVSLPVMLLWNWVVPIIFKGAVESGALNGDITWLQALGLMLLTSFLFKSTSVSSKSS